MANRRQPKRSEVWLVRFDPAIGAEMRKLRPAVVLNMDGVGRLPLRIVVPITDWKPQHAQLSWLVNIPVTSTNGLLKESGADAFQVKSVSESRFVRCIGTITANQLDDIASAVALCVGAP